MIYTALETYSFSLGVTPAPIQTIVQTPAANYTCLYIPGGSFTYTTCTSDQSSALKISLAIGFFLAVFLSFLKQIPKGGTPPLADDDDDDDPVPAPTAGRKGKNKKKKRQYRRGVVYAEGNFYYLDFGDYHIWGHALLSFVAFGTLSLFSASVSQCLFPGVRPWIFVFTQVILLVICCFIAMFWVDDPSLSIGLMVVPPSDVTPHNPSSGTQTSPPPSSPPTPTPPMTTLDAAAAGAPFTPSTVAEYADIARTSTLMTSAVSMTSAMSSTTAVGGSGAVSRMAMLARRTSTMSSVSEKQDQDQDQDQELANDLRDPEKPHVTMDVQRERVVAVNGVGEAKVSGHLSLRID